MSLPRVPTVADPRGRDERIQAARNKLNAFRAKRAKLAQASSASQTTPASDQAVRTAPLPQPTPAEALFAARRQSRPLSRHLPPPTAGGALPRHHNKRHSRTSSISISLPPGEAPPVALPPSSPQPKRTSLFVASRPAGHIRGHSRANSRSLSHARNLSGLKLGGPDRASAILAIEHGAGTTAATFHPANADAWVDENDHTFSLSNLPPAPPSDSPRASRVPPPRPAEPAAAPSSPVRRQPPDPAGERHSRRASRHVRQESIVTKRQSMEVMGGVGMGLAPLGPPGCGEGAGKRASVRRSGVLDAAVLFGSSSRASHRLSSHRRSTSRFDLAGVPEIAALPEPHGDPLSALQKLEGRPGPSHFPVSILKSPQPLQSSGGGGEGEPGSGRSPLPKRASRLRFSLPPSPSPDREAPPHVDQRGSRSSVQLPEFDELHGADGMDEQRFTSLLEANEKSTASDQKADPAFHPESDEGLDTLVEEEEGEEEDESKRLKRPPEAGSGDHSSRVQSNLPAASLRYERVHSPPQPGSSPARMSAQDRRALWRQSMPTSSSLRMLRLSTSASIYQPGRSSPDTTSPVPQRRLSRIGYNKSDHSSSSDAAPISVGEHGELPLHAERGAKHASALQSQLEQAQAQAHNRAAALTELEVAMQCAADVSQSELAQAKAHISELEAALQKAQDQSLDWQARAAQAEDAQHRAQEDADASRKAVAELESTLADTTAERDTYLEDVDGWRQRCGDLEASLAREKERGQAEALCRAVLAGKAQRLLKRLDRAGAAVPDEDRLSAWELLPPTHARGDASPNLSAGRSIGSLPDGTSPRPSPRRALSPLLDPAHPPAEETIKLLADMRQQIFTLAATLEHEKRRRSEVEQQLERSLRDASGDSLRPNPPAHPVENLPMSPARSTSLSLSVLGEATTDPVFQGEPPKCSSPLGSEEDPASPLGPVEFICPAEIVDVSIPERAGRAPVPTSDSQAFEAENVFQIGSSGDDVSSPLPPRAPTPRRPLGHVDVPQAMEQSRDAPSAQEAAAPSSPASPALPHKPIDVEAGGSKVLHEVHLAVQEEEAPVPQASAASPSSPEVRDAPRQPAVSDEFSRSSLPSWRDSHGTSSPGSESHDASSPPEPQARTLALGPTTVLTPEEESLPRRSDELFPAMTWSFSSAASRARQKQALAAQVQRESEPHDFFGIDTELGLPPLPSTLPSLDLPPVPLTGLPLRDTHRTRQAKSQPVTSSSFMGVTSTVLSGLGGYLLARPSVEAARDAPAPAGTGMQDHPALPQGDAHATSQATDAYRGKASDPRALQPSYRDAPVQPAPRRLVPRMGVTYPPSLLAAPRESLDFAPLTEGVGAWPVFAI